MGFTMFRLEQDAAFRCEDTTRPDPRHRGISFVQRTYVLSTGNGADVELSPAFGKAIAEGQLDRPQPMGRADGLYWWIFRDRVYSTPDRLSRAAVLRKAERERVALTTPELRLVAPQQAFRRSSLLVSARSM